MSFIATGTPCNGPTALPFAAALVECARLTEGIAGIEMYEGMYLVVDRRNAVETGTGHFLGGNIAVRYTLCNLNCGERCQIVFSHRQFAYSLLGSHKAMPGNK